MKEDNKNPFQKMGLIEPVKATITEELPPAWANEGSDAYLMDQDPVEGMSLLQCLIGVFTSPARTFRSLTVKTHLWWPLVIFAVLTLITTYLSMDAMESFTRITMDAALAKNPQPGLTPEMVESQLQMSMKLILIFTPLMALVTPLIKGLVTQGTAALFDGKGKMKVTLSVIALSYAIIMVGGLVRLPLMMASSSLVTFSPALLLAPEQLGSAWANFLMNFDVFTLWYLGVSAIGVKEVHRISYGKSLITVLIPFGLVLLMGLSGILMEKLM